MPSKIDNDLHWLNVAHEVSLQSKCIKRKVGSVIVDKNGRVVATGHNFHPRGTSQDHVCLRKDIPSGEKMADGYCCHAEQNAITFANFNDMQGATLYITHASCKICARMIMQAGIGELVYYKEELERETGVSLFKELGSAINIRSYEKPRK
jgi:dCMP deaminase